MQKASKKSTARSFKSKKKGVEKEDTTISFRDLKPNNTLKDIDEKISFFKSRLTSLLGNKSSDNCKGKKLQAGISNLPETNRFSRDPIDEDKLGNKETFNKDDNGVFNYEEFNIRKPGQSRNTSEIVSSKFSKWLNSTIDSIDEEVKAKRRRSVKKNSKRSGSDLPQNKVENLLYKSFLLQNLGKYSSDESEPEITEILVKPKATKKTSSNVSKRKGNVTRKRGRKRRRVVMCDSSYSDADLITIDFPNEASSSSRADIEDIDLEGIDWNEPFGSEEYNSQEPSIVEEIISSDDRNKSITSRRSYNLRSSPSLVQCNSNKVESNNGEIMSCGSSRKSKSSWECPICFEPSKGQEVVTTLCGHVFCKGCIENYHTVQGKFCPNCRTDLSDKPLITLFNI